ncbi:MAG: MFS transporter, partial [Actinobacteria bacterium]|nr:MFS transporter [Actinomycetota bacterium]
QGLAGVVVGAATLPGIVLAPVMGLLADRYGRREVIVPCLVVFGVAGGLAGAAPSLWVLVGMRLLQGAGSAGLINLAVVLIGDHWEGHERSRLIGRNAAVLTTSLAVMPALGGLLTELGGWRAPFGVYPLALVTGIALARTLPRSVPRDVVLSEQLGDLWPVLRTRTVAGVLGAGTVTFALIFGLALTVLPIHLRDEFGLGAGYRGVLLGLPALTNTAVALSLGRLQRHFRRTGQLGTAAALLASALVAVAVAPSLPVLVAGILVFGVGEGLMIPNLQDLATRAGPVTARGTVVASFVGASRLGQTAGPLVAGAGLAAVGAPATFAAGAGVAAALGAVLMAGGRRRA